jgi:hypothetical protein
MHAEKRRILAECSQENPKMMALNKRFDTLVLTENWVEQY